MDFVAARAKRSIPMGADTASVRYFNAEDRGPADEVAAHLRTDTPNGVVHPVNAKGAAGST
jgi:hypothetical protein